MNKRDKELAKQAGCHSVVLLDVYGGEGLCDSELDDLNSLQKFADLIRADEREACAKICDFEWGTGAEKDAGIVFAAVIRARGNT